MKNRFGKLGFTLIELLIVITIIGILAVVFLPNIMGAPAKSRDAARQADLGNIVQAIESMRFDGVTVKALGDIDPSECVDTALSGYISYFPGKIIPTDPLKSNTGIGTCNTDGKYTIEIYKKGYGVFAKLEDDVGNINCTDDATGVRKGGANVDSPTPFATKDKGCYGVIMK